jgi:tetratricopeptide (TPR) repeat protein
MKIKIVPVVVFLFSLFLTTLCFSREKEDYIEKGDEYYKKWEYKNALIEYLKAYKLDPDNYNVLWKISRSYIDLGDKADKKIRENYYEKSIEFADKAITIDPNGADGHFWKAAALGKMVKVKGGKTKIELAMQMKKELDTVIQIDPSYHSAYYIYGRLQRGVANLNRILKSIAKAIYGDIQDATNEKAIEYFQKAVDLKPDVIAYRYELGKTFTKIKNWECAKEQLQLVSQLPIIEEEDLKYRQEACELYDDIKDKN